MPKTHLSAKDENFEDVIAELEDSRITIEKEQNGDSTAIKQKSAISAMNCSSKQEKIDQRREKLLKDANDRAACHFTGSKRLRRRDHQEFPQIRKSQRFPSKIWKQERSKLREKIDSAQSKSQSKNTAKPKKKAESR